MDEDVMFAQLERDGYRHVQILEASPHDERAAHAHDFDLSAIVLAGSVTLTTGGQSYHYGPGDRFDMAAGTVHAEAVGPQGVRYVVGRRG